MTSTKLWRPKPSVDAAQFPRDLFWTAPAELIPRGCDAYLVGTGPSLSPAVLAQIPRDAWLGVLNKAIIDVVSMGVPARLIDAWFCSTPEYWRQAPWWPKANELARTHRIARVFSWQLDAQGIECDYTYQTQPSFGDPLAPDQLVPGVLRSGGTIAAVGGQWPAHCEAARLILVAIDMRGPLYCDGSKSSRPGKDGEWCEMPVAVRTFRAIAASGCHLATVTPTALSNYLEIEELY